LGLATSHTPFTALPRDRPMGFLKSFFDEVFEQERPTRPTASPSSSFAEVSDAELEAHLKVARYGDFTLSDAIRPSYTLDVIPSSGYRHDVYRDEEGKNEVPVLMASVTCERVLDTFMELIE